MKILVVLAVLLSATGASAQTIDGDTIRLGGVKWRLHAMDAPELRQSCLDGWPAGRIAASRLQGLIRGRNVICQKLSTDRYNRNVGICTVSGQDLGAILVREGLAHAYVKYSRLLVPQEDLARAEGLGVHRHGCIPGWAYRARQR